MHDLSEKLQEVIEEINSFKENVLYLNETIKKDHGIVILGQYILTWFGNQKEQGQTLSYLYGRIWLKIFKIYSISAKD